jgi:hypothetical protein
MSSGPPTSPSRCACSALAAVLLASCAGSLDDLGRFARLDGGNDGGVGPTGDGGCDPVPTVFVPSCATSACHSAQTQQANLDLQSPGLPQRFVEKRATGGPGYLIDSQDPGKSVLYLKVTSSPPFNFQMPPGAPPLSSDEVACILTWVSAAVGK